jgi:hypothetical protein
MKTTTKDDRTKKQKQTHHFGVIARDTFMSHWGAAKGGISRVAWACSSREDASKVYDWVKERKEMKSVSTIDLRKHKVNSRDAHFHIYVVKKTHPALLWMMERLPTI